MNFREHLTEAARHLWAVYENAALLNSFSALVAVRSQLDDVLSKLENVDDVVGTDG